MSSKARYRLAISQMLVTKAGKRKNYLLGDYLDDCHAGVLKRMIDLQQAVTEGEFHKLYPPEDGEADEPPSPDWKETKVAELGLSAKVVAALVGKEFGTVADVLEFGEKNNGLTSIDGIGEATEREIQQAIIALQPK